jgi:hypothetical protein
MIGWAWTAAILALVVTLVLCTVSLLRKGLGLLRELADFVSLPAILDGVHRADPEPRPTPAVLRPFAEVVAHRDGRRQRTTERRIERREARLARARSLISAEVNPRDWPTT